MLRTLLPAFTCLVLFVASADTPPAAIEAPVEAAAAMHAHGAGPEDASFAQTVPTLLAAFQAVETTPPGAAPDLTATRALAGATATTAVAPPAALRGGLMPWGATPTQKPGAELPPYTTAAKALVMDEASGEVLYQHGGEHAAAAPASLTKIVTALVAIERGNLDEVVTVDVDSRKMGGSSLMGLLPGDRFTLRDLLYGLMLPSGNDAALAIGRHIAGSDAAFAQQMNALMARLGLSDSRFANPHGLAAPDHRTSAYDLAMVSRYAMRQTAFGEIVSATEYTARGSREIAMGSLISGMLNWVPGVDGVKSGFTEQAGSTLVTSALRDGHRVYVVVLNDRNYAMDSAALLEWAFRNYDWQPAS